MGRKKKHGVTLVELAVTVAVLGIVSFLVPLLFRMFNSFTYVRHASQLKTDVRSFLWQINHDIENANEAWVVGTGTTEMVLRLPDFEQYGRAPYPVDKFEEPTMLGNWVSATIVKTWDCTAANKDAHVCKQGAIESVRPSLEVRYRYLGNPPRIERLQKRYLNKTRYDCSPPVVDVSSKTFLAGRLYPSKTAYPLFQTISNSDVANIPGAAFSIYLRTRHPFMKDQEYRQYTAISNMRSPNGVREACVDSTVPNPS